MGSKNENNDNYSTNKRRGLNYVFLHSVIFNISSSEDYGCYQVAVASGFHSVDS